MSFLLYLDENVDVALAQALRQQGYDVISAREVEDIHNQFRFLGEFR